MMRQQTRMEWKPYDTDEYRQEKQGIVVEIKDSPLEPKALTANVQKCNALNVLEADKLSGRPVMEQVSIAGAAGAMRWFKVAITNGNEHVLRMNHVVVRLFDPAGNQIEPVSKETLVTISWLTDRVHQVIRLYRLFGF